ncbi:MAG: hypothetical protein IH905_07355 [Proteobacteria bacterium]|nr:hypothetical protein [Pseudomonadota bacterium]
MLRGRGHRPILHFCARSGGALPGGLFVTTAGGWLCLPGFIPFALHASAAFGLVAFGLAALGLVAFGLVAFGLALAALCLTARGLFDFGLFGLRFLFRGLGPR